MTAQYVAADMEVAVVTVCIYGIERCRWTIEESPEHGGPWVCIHGTDEKGDRFEVTFFGTTEIKEMEPG